MRRFSFCACAFAAALILPGGSAAAGQDVANVHAASAFEELVEVIESAHAYAALRKVDLRQRASEAVARLGDEPSREELIIEMHRLVCALGDGHAEIDEFLDALPRGFLPLLLARSEGGIVAFASDRSALLDPARPYVMSIDRQPVAQWLDAVKPFVPAGSPQLVQERSLRLLRWINFARKQMNLPMKDELWIELADESGEDRAFMRLKVADRRPIYGEWPRTQTRMIDDSIAYVRAAQMRHDEDDLAELRLFLNDAAARPGLRGVVIDIRGNGGGSRDALRALLPHFMKPGGEEAIVINAARYRLQPGDEPARDDGYLANRGLYPLTWRGWSDAERLAIEEFAMSFMPRWTVPDEGFSDWHYCVISRTRDGNDAAYIDRPVVVLIDEVCFSAADIFAGAFQLLPNVTLIGMPTAGGSARAQSHRLQRTGARVRLATMASYQANGELYDGNGISPDIFIEAAPTFHVGGEDRVLDRAIEFISSEPALP